MVSLTRSRAVLELGSRLVSELDAADDLLASWMAHYISQLIEAAERAPAEAKATAQEACAKSILELWRYRSILPDRLRPFAELESVLRTLASLDVEQTNYRYYPQALREAETANIDKDTKQWLEFATGVDFAARLLIQSALRSASLRAAVNAEPWVKLAAQAGAEEGAEAFIVKFALQGDDEGKADENARDAVLRNRLSKMDAFVKMATSLMENLRTQLSVEKVEKE
ncbi:hypothetical protein [Pyxidicoccus trucidator]|uniref:hypothetical protein n=1 Tax=Pyxidicoccus trucidator TaxID=2709662 RepID=UPI0013DA7B1E|nr:hypothetical protein [Pyxidicoccus trucidator]